ncbi:hypothetical protein LPC08_25045 (plasmid) [Roseomonas sp. OT10]|uniref:aspartate racemase/maleate isomerase family protein n=1 Tax=Roseomonas cutis TaxID=2897332 RepID=UPI001E2E93FB|nr:hypothetical protein [Roseomonas sp. OT10]UFN51539.1 hypothetical protein LPC08_25045 [Roseomonas sp. OT10]
MDLRPKHQLGYVLPVNVGDYIHYQFYRVAPQDCMLVCAPIGLQAFSSSGTEQALEKFWPAIEFLGGRGVQRITQGGIPVSAHVGRQRMLAMIEEAERRTSISCSADFEESIDALRELGVRKVAVAAKWNAELMARVADYLREAGLDPVGVVAEPHTAQEVLAIQPDPGADMAIALGRRAFRDHPSAEGLLLAGGSWLSLQAVPALEAEFSRPVVTNPTASYWAFLRQCGRAAQPGMGHLLGTLSEAPVRSP